MRNTREIEDELLAVERGFAGGNGPIINGPGDAPAGVKRRRNKIPRDQLMNLVNLEIRMAPDHKGSGSRPQGSRFET
jgi:hypothetical protein